MTVHRHHNLDAAITPGRDLSVSAGIDLRRCWTCRTIRPRAAMRWRSRERGPRWNPRQLRVLCCPDCLDAAGG